MSDNMHEVVVSSTDIESSINRQLLLLNHEVTLAEFESTEELKKTFKKLDISQLETASTANEYQDVNFDLKLKNRVSIMDIANAERTAYDRKFFLCRVLAPWAFVHDTADTVVDDPEGKYGFQLNVSIQAESRSEFMAKMRPGTLLAVLNPQFRSACYPSAICIFTVQSRIVVNQSILESLSVVWKGEIPRVNPVRSQDEYRQIGNGFFKEKRYHEACFFYTKGLSLSQIQKDPAVLSNRAAAYISLHCYQLALHDTEEVLLLNPNHSKAIYRKVRALCGIRRYEEAGSFLQAKLKSSNELDNLDDLKKLEAKVKEYIKQSKTGHYDLFALAESTMDASEADCAEYIGPFDVRADKERKAKIVVATRDVQPGELIMAIRAFNSILWMDHDASLPQVNLLPKPYSNCSTPYHDKLVDIIKKRLLKESDMVSKFLDIEHPAKKYGKKDDQNCTGFFDSKLISDIVSYRGTVTPYRQKKRLGVYLEPSFVGHSCFEYNARWIILGDMYFLRAIKSIGKDKEIITSKSLPFEPYSFRTNMFNHHNFVCKCSLCVAEKILGTDITDKAYELEKMSLDYDDMASLRECIALVEHLKSKQPLANVNHVKLFIKVATMLQYKYENKPAAFKAWKKVFELLENTPYINDVLEALICMNELAKNQIYDTDFKKERCEMELKKYWSILVGPENVNKVLRSMDKDTMIQTLDLV